MWICMLLCLLGAFQTVHFEVYVIRCYLSPFSLPSFLLLLSLRLLLSLLTPSSLPPSLLLSLHLLFLLTPSSSLLSLSFLSPSPSLSPSSSSFRLSLLPSFLPLPILPPLPLSPSPSPSLSLPLSSSLYTELRESGSHFPHVCRRGLGPRRSGIRRAKFQCGRRH